MVDDVIRQNPMPMSRSFAISFLHRIYSRDVFWFGAGITRLAVLPISGAMCQLRRTEISFNKNIIVN